MTGEHRIVVTSEGAGMRLDRYLADALPALSRTTVARLVTAGGVLVDGRTAASSRRLAAGEVITCNVPEPAPTDALPQDIELRVLHEDDELVVIDKAAGMAVHPGAGLATGTLVNVLIHRYGAAMAGVGGARRPGIVHRLDKGTTGVLVAAKTANAYARLTGQFAARTVGKDYLAVVLGDPGERGEIDGAIGRSRAHRTRMAVLRSGGRSALTAWVRREPFGREAALIQVELMTGRTHQIRVHLASVGHPLVGDATYGGGRAASVRDPQWRRALTGLGRPALHAWRLAFDHPSTGVRLQLEAPLAADLVELVADLRRLSPPPDGVARGRGRP